MHEIWNKFFQFRKTFTLNTEVNGWISGPLPAALLLPLWYYYYPAWKKNEKFIKYASYTTKTYLKSFFLVSHLSRAGNTVDLRARKFCLVFRRWEKCCVHASVSLLLKSLEGNKMMIQRHLWLNGSVNDLLSRQYSRNFPEVVALDSFNDQFADPLICNVIIPETDEGEIRGT